MIYNYQVQISSSITSAVIQSSGKSHDLLI